MKNILLGLAACTVSLATLAQEPFTCSTDEMRRRVIEMDPTYLAREAAYAAEIRQLIADNTSMRDDYPVITIPIVFHILHLGGAENIPDQQVYDQMDILNEDFRMLNSDTSFLVPFFRELAKDARIEFRLPTLDPLGNCTNGINRIFTVETLRGRDESMGAEERDDVDLAELGAFVGQQAFRGRAISAERRRVDHDRRFFGVHLTSGRFSARQLLRPPLRLKTFSKPALRSRAAARSGAASPTWQRLRSAGCGSRCPSGWCWAAAH